MANQSLGVDSNGIQKTMRRIDYFTDTFGQLGLGIIGNIVGQITYFYTDKVGLAVGSVGIILAIAKVIDAFTDVIFGNMIDHSKGGNQKYYKWMAKMGLPAAITMVLLFCVPIQLGQLPALLYALVTNVLLTAVFYTIISTPFAAIQVVRTKSQEERSKMGIYRAIASYGSGMFVVIATIPLTNLLGGNQSAWIKYGAILAMIVFLGFMICYWNGRQAVFAGEEDEVISEDEGVPFREALHALFHNKYWIIVLLFNVLTNITNAASSTSVSYYTKWIFGNDNLVALLGGLGFLGTIVGFLISNPMIRKLGVRNTVKAGLLGAAVCAGIRCLAPGNLIMYAVTSVLGSMIQIPLMCLYGVLLGMSVDYNEYKYDNKMVATASGAVGFGNKVGAGLGTLLLTVFLALGSYDATLEVATTSMRMSIFGFANVVPIVVNLVMYVIFLGFDLEQKLPQMKEEIAQRRRDNI